MLFDCQRRLDIIKQHDEGITVRVLVMLVVIDRHAQTNTSWCPGKAICIGHRAKTARRIAEFTTRTRS